jgi:hypothetical protein
LVSTQFQTLFEKQINYKLLSGANSINIYNMLLTFATSVRIATDLYLRFQPTSNNERHMYTDTCTYVHRDTVHIWSIHLQTNKRLKLHICTQMTQRVPFSFNDIFRRATH